jgi:hydrogenase maturation protease
MDTGKTVRIVGVGNRHRRDDGVGLVVAQRLRSEALPGVSIVESGGDAAELIDAWGGVSRVWVIDAVHSGAAPGTVVRVDAVGEALPAEAFQTSTHALGLAAAVELARALGQLPPSLVVFGIEGMDFGHGEGLSPEVAAAASEVVDRLRREIVSCSPSP